MAKTSKKSSKRRLKKSVRKTFGGLFLATSILVAAIPFPEAAAADYNAGLNIPAYEVTEADYTYGFEGTSYKSNTIFVGPNGERTLGEYTPGGSGDSSGDVTPTPADDVTPTPADDVTPSPTVEVTPTPAGDITPSPTVEVTPTPAGDETPSPTVDVTPTPAGDEAPSPTVDVTPTPAGDETPSPSVDVTPSASDDVTPSPTSVAKIDDNYILIDRSIENVEYSSGTNTAIHMQLLSAPGGSTKPDEKKGVLQRSMSVTTDTIGNRSVKWKYEYWMPEGGSEGYITNFNDSFFKQPSPLNVEGIVYSNLVYVLESDVADYRNHTDESDFVVKIHRGDGEPSIGDTRSVTSLNRQYTLSGAYNEANADHRWLNANFPDAVETYRAEYAAAEDPSSVTPITRTLRDKYTTYDEQKDYLLTKVFDLADGEATYSNINYGDDLRIFVAESSGRRIVINGKECYVDDYGFPYSNSSEIVGIGAEAFKNKSSITDLSFNPEIKFIGDSAFEGSSINSVKLYQNTQIGNRTFAESDLSSVDFVNGKFGIIPAEAFYNCKLVSVTIPDGCTYIGAGAFANNKYLTNVSFAGGTKDIEICKFAFYDAQALNNVDFSDANVVSIGKAAFATTVETGNLERFVFPSYITNDGRLGEDGKDINIGSYCLAGRYNLKQVYFPTNRKFSGELDDTIFYECRGLEFVSFDESCAGLYWGDDARGDIMFYSVTNPDFYVTGKKYSKTDDGHNPRQSTWVSKMNYDATGGNGDFVPYMYIENVDGEEVCYYEVFDGTYLSVIDEDGLLISCEVLDDSGDGEFIIPSEVGGVKVTGIKKGCFSKEVIDSIINLVIQDGGSIELLDDELFAGAEKLETVYIGDSVTELGDKTFADCGALKKVIISENIETIGEGTFQNSKNLENIVFKTPDDYAKFPEGSIGKDAFNTGASKLTIVGEIVEGYAPFEWATDVENYASSSQSIRTLYKSPLPSEKNIKQNLSSGLSVILDNNNNLVTLVDYPHYEDIDHIVFNPENNSLVELDKVPQEGEDDYTKTIKYKIDNKIALNQYEENYIQKCSSLNIPLGVESVDSKGFFTNTSKNLDGINSYKNDASISAYFSPLISPYNEYAKNGLFNGFYGTEVGVDGLREYENKDENELEDRGNDRLTSVVMNEVRYLPDRAFENCENLGEVYLGNGIEDIGKLPFVGCSDLASVTISNPEYLYKNGIIYKNNGDGNTTIVECLESRGRLTGDSEVSIAKDAELANVSEIEEGAFTGCDSIDTVDFTGVNNLKKIPKDCFKDCEGLIQVDLPVNIDSIGDYAFDTHGSFLKVTVRNKNLSLGSNTNGEEGSKVKKSYYETYKDAQSREVAANQKYDVGTYTLKGVYQVEYRTPDGNTFYTEYDINEGDNAKGPAENLIPKIPGMKFVGWTGSLENITKNEIIYARYELDPTQNVTPTPTTGPTPAPTGSVDPQPTGGSNIEPTLYPNNPDTITPTSTPDGGDDGWDDGWDDDSDDDSDDSNQQNTTKKYKLTVEYGSGSGDYVSGLTLIIEAINPPAGKVFDKWVVTKGNPWIYSATSKATTIKMPASDCTITATYKDSNGNAARQSVNIGNSKGNTTSSSVNKRYGTVVDINKPGISNVDKAYASVSGSSDNFIVKILDNNEASNMIATYLAQRYADMSPIKYYAMELALYDANGVNKISGYDGLSIMVTIPIPDALVAYAGNNRVAAVDGSTLIDIPCKFVTVDGIPCVSFTATKFGIPYTIYADTSNLTYGTIDSTPKTGDGIHPKWLVSIALFCCSMILFLKKDKVTKRVRTA